MQNARHYLGNNLISTHHTVAHLLHKAHLGKNGTLDTFHNVTLFLPDQLQAGLFHQHKQTGQIRFQPCTAVSFQPLLQSFYRKKLAQLLCQRPAVSRFTQPAVHSILYRFRITLQLFLRQQLHHTFFTVQ